MLLQVIMKEPPTEHVRNPELSGNVFDLNDTSGAGSVSCLVVKMGTWHSAGLVF